jgi:hypothetical protein
MKDKKRNAIKTGVDIFEESLDLRKELNHMGLNSN